MRIREAQRYRQQSAGPSAARPAPVPQDGPGLSGLRAAADLSHPRQQTSALQARARGHNATGARPAVPVMQRAAVIPYDTWKSRSTKAGMKRSELLLRIDEALILYQASVFLDVKTQKTRLQALSRRINAWIGSKNAKYASKKRNSRRMKEVQDLKDQVDAKQIELNNVPDDNPDVGKRTIFTFDVYNRIRLRVQQIMSVPPRDIETATAEKMVSGLAEMREQVRDIDGYHDPVTAIWDACSVMIALGETRLNVAVAAKTRRRHPRPVPLERYKSRYRRHYARAEAQIAAQNDTGHTVAPHVLASMQKTREDVALYSSVAGKGDGAEADFDLPEGFEDSMDLAGEAMNALGMQGTGGVGNEGLEDYWKTTIPEGESEQKTAAKQMAATIMGGLHSAIEDDPGAMDKVSGGADIGASAVMSVRLGAELGRLFAIVSDCNRRLKTDPGNSKLKAKRRKAIAELTFLSTVGTTEMLGKYLGGAFTAMRGDGHKFDSNMFSSDSTDVSTDMKLTGDAAGVVLGAVNSVKDIVNMCKNIFARAKPVKNDSKSLGEHGQDLFDSVHEIAGATNSVAKSYSAVRKLYEQIAAGGQIASENAGAVSDVVRGTVNNVPVIPVLGLIKGCMDFVSEGIKLARTGHAAHKAKAMGKKLTAQFSEPLYLAFVVTRDKFVKQINRAIIDLIHAAASITSGALSVSGLGAGIGAAIGMVSLAAKLTQTGIRKFKQHRRDKKGGEETNLEKAAATADGEEFVNHALLLTQEKLAGKKKRGRYNLDKTTANKEFRYNFAAMEILRAPEEERKWFFDALNIRRDVQRIENNDTPGFNKEQAKMALIIKSLKER
ncbi:hypothetical protein [uncultured Roseobacter sp.]|uniref:hypothetical protein n=1 Tax=uncultured Roseobacter sp. TaxID=114847 RepID=UPI002610A44D|nr:hypothetical protein [uncultured Roseobacter sp.]